MLQERAAANYAKVSAKVKTIGEPAKMVNFHEDAGEVEKKGVKRKGTGFVTAGQVRALMAADYSDSDEEESDNEEDDDEELERQVNASLEKSNASGGATRIAVSAERHEVP